MARPAVDATDHSQQVSAVFADIDKKDSPGCALAVVQGGKIVYQHGYGMANLDYQIPIAPSSIFYIASNSKQFTAFSVALLSEQGQIALSDPITKYIPELPSEVYGKVTVDHLVHHSSGVRDYWGLRDLRGSRVDAG
jgi:CubicO group peptidase (beta-lactamase class C family)